jgi:hypothetical protein
MSASLRTSTQSPGRSPSYLDASSQSRRAGAPDGDGRAPSGLGKATSVSRRSSAERAVTCLRRRSGDTSIGSVLRDRDLRLRHLADTAAGLEHDRRSVYQDAVGQLASWRAPSGGMVHRRRWQSYGVHEGHRHPAGLAYKDLVRLACPRCRNTGSGANAGSHGSAELTHRPTGYSEELATRIRHVEYTDKQRAHGSLEPDRVSGSRSPDETAPDDDEFKVIVRELDAVVHPRGVLAE